MPKNVYRKSFPRDIRHDATISGIDVFTFGKRIIPSFIVGVFAFIMFLANINSVPPDFRIVHIIKSLILSSLIPAGMIAFYKFNLYHKLQKMRVSKSGHLDIYPKIKTDGVVFRDGHGFSSLLLITPTPIFVLTQTAIDQRKAQFKNLLSFCAKNNIQMSVHVIRRILPGSFFTDKLFDKIVDVNDVYMQTFMAARAGYWSQRPCAVTFHYLKLTVYPKLLQLQKQGEEKAVEHLSAGVKATIDFLSRCNFDVQIVKDEGIIQVVAAETGRFVIPSSEWLFSPPVVFPEPVKPLGGVPMIMGTQKSSCSKRKNVILVRSFIPGVGTTTVAANLAYLLSEYNTVAVDTNVSCPLLAESLGVERQTDTYYVHIANGVSPDQVMLFGPKRLRVMPGPVGNDLKVWPIDIEKFIDSLSSYDYVVIDSEPGIYDQMTRKLERLATKIVLVTDSSSTARYVFDTVYDDWKSTVDTDVVVVYNKRRDNENTKFIPISLSNQIDAAFERRVPVTAFSPVLRAEFTKLIKCLK